MLYGLTNDMDWMTIGRLSSLMGAIKITSQGGQNHVLTREAIEQRPLPAALRLMLHVQVDPAAGRGTLLGLVSPEAVQRP